MGETSLTSVMLLDVPRLSPELREEVNLDRPGVHEHPIGIRVAQSLDHDRRLGLSRLVHRMQGALDLRGSEPS